MTTATEKSIGIIGYSPSCESIIWKGGRATIIRCSWKSSTIFPSSTLAGDALQAHIDNIHRNQPSDTLLGYVIPVDALPMEATTHA